MPTKSTPHRIGRFAFLGITDDHTTCECCGRSGLKRTIAIAELDADGNRGEAVYYGSTCAALALRTSSERVLKIATAAQAAAERAAANRARYAATFERIERALLGTPHLAAASVELNVAAHAGDELARAALANGASLAERTGEHPILAARAWYAEHARA